jgi:hypothetical protein
LRRCGGDASGLFAASAMEKCLDELRHLGAVCCATALALAAVFLLAAVVAGLTSALAFAVVLAFTGVLGWLVSVGIAKTCLRSLDSCTVRRALRVRNRCSADQAGKSSRQKKCIELVLHG